MSALLCAALPLLVAAAPPPAPDAEPDVRLFDSAAQAVTELLGERPRIMAFGEYHQTTATTAIRSPLFRFTDQLFPMIGPLASDLVLETWVTDGSCGEQEKQVAKNITKTTRRPQKTESELVTLIKTVQASFVRPHILTLTCAEYQALREASGEVDYDRLLKLITQKLVQKATELYQKQKEGRERVVLIYGGALHNDLFPREEFRAYAFGRELLAAAAGKYLEVDLYVPEYIERDEEMQKEPWYARYRKAARPGKACLVRRGPGSYIILFPRGGK